MPNENDNKLVTLADLAEVYNSLNTKKKSVQTVVNNPTASGTAVSFIDSISQNAQGVISPTKKTVQEATQSAAGLMSAADKIKIDGIADTYVTKSDIVNNLSQTTSGSVLDATQGKALLDKIKASVIVGNQYTIVAGTSSDQTVAGITADHRVIFWGFSGGYSENNPPADITVTTSTGKYIIAATNVIASNITMRPVFIAPQS